MMNKEQSPPLSKPVEKQVYHPNSKAELGSSDGPLESIAKAVTDPIRSAADGEEPPDDGSHAPVPPG